MSEPRPLHRLFTLSWIDFFQDTDIRVEPERDMSLKQQFIDVVLIRRGNAPIARKLPDGFEELAAHNLVTFESHQEALDAWALEELIGHYVNYRKQSSPSLQNLLPASDYRLLAVCARYPQSLAQELALTRVQPGVYDVRMGVRLIRVIVVAQLPQEEHNAMLHLSSARPELLRYGRDHYRPHSSETSSLLLQLLRNYREDPNMSDQMKELVRETMDDLLQSLPAEERLKGLPAEELRKRLSPEERVEGLDAEDRLKGLSVEERFRGLSAEEVAQALPQEVLDALSRKHKVNGSSEKAQ